MLIIWKIIIHFTIKISSHFDNSDILRILNETTSLLSDIFSTLLTYTESLAFQNSILFIFIKICFQIFIFHFRQNVFILKICTEVQRNRQI